MTAPTVALDLDGVVWRGDHAVPGSAAAVAQLRAAGVRVAFLTNNSSLTIADYRSKLAAMDVAAGDDDLLTSAQAAARLVSSSLAPGARVLACAGAGVVEALRDVGLDVVDAAPADAVVVGFTRAFDFDLLDRAAAAVRDGARFVATNADPTYPGEQRLLPGAGALAAAVAAAAGVTPEVAGKPQPPMVDLVRARLGDQGVMVGDRPSTDGAFAAAIGWPFALVLSGIASRTPARGEEPVPDPAPPFVADDLRALVPALLAALDRA